MYQPRNLGHFVTAAHADLDTGHLVFDPAALVVGLFFSCLWLALPMLFDVPESGYGWRSGLWAGAGV